ncbi:MAG: hypothetical protein VB857_11425 [Pirellulaceae bacterium]
MVNSWALGCLLVAAVGCWLLLANVRRLRGSTLMGPWSWALLGLWFVAAVEVYRGLNSAASDHWFLTIQFAAAVTTLLPAVALLGAQRPHDRIWQFVVASLWLILVLPAVKNSLLEPAAIFQLHPAWGWSLWVLVVVGLINRICTRYWFSALLVTVGQCRLLSGQLPGLGQDVGAAGTLIALGCFVLAILLVHVQWRWDPAIPPRTFNQAWRDFRDLYGVLWAFRIADRINTLAERQEWDLQLRWQGLASPAADGDQVPVPAEVEVVLCQNMRNLLRRFVAVDWLDSRLPAGDGPPAAESTL